VIDEAGTENLGTSRFTCEFGNVAVPGLQNIELDIASLTAENIAATASALTDLQLGAAVAQQIQARNIMVPSQGFTIAGIGIGALRLGGLGAPAASVDSVTIGRVHGDAFPIPDVTLSNVALPSASVSDIVSQSVDAVATPQGKAYHIDLGCVDLILKIRPRAEAQIDQLTISGLRAGISVGAIELLNVVAPYELLNLRLSQVGIETVEIPAIAVA
jgi:hypothetical protein